MTRCPKASCVPGTVCLYVLRCLHSAVDEKTQASEVVPGRDGVQFPVGAHHASLEHNS